MSGIRCQERKCFHSNWIQFPYLDIFSREGLDQAFKQLLDNNEIKLTTKDRDTVPRSPLLTQCIFENIPDFQRGYLVESQFADFIKHLQDRIEYSALSLFTDSPCIIVLQQRAAVLSRVSRAIYATQELYVMREQQQQRNTQSSIIQTQILDTNKAPYSTADMLVETGVRTGLQLFFSLLKQQLQIQSIYPQIDTQLCKEVLTSLRDTLAQFPPKFLASYYEISVLGQTCIQDLELFLQQIIFHSSTIDTHSRSLAAETQLTLTIGKASLTQLLEYFSKVLSAKSGAIESENVSNTNPYVSREHLQKVLNEMYQTKVDSCGDTAVGPVQAEGDQVTLYRATFLLFQQLLFLANTRCSALIDRVSSLESFCEVFGFGSNSGGQFGLGNGSSDKSPIPIKLKNMSNCSYVCAGYYCTLAVYPDGYYEACGKGSYGRLGTGSSSNCAVMTKVEIKGVKFVRILSSKGTEGHTLGLTSDGQVYSWGEGENGRLGHGNSTSYSSPKLIEGPFSGKIIKSISVGYKHSAAISMLGELYTWGDGEGGKLGHNNTTSQSRPTLVSGITGALQVSCGLSHTLALSEHNIVWSWGLPDGGKLGHGDTKTKLFVPKEIISLRGRNICKIQTGNSVSIALSTNGKLYSWGAGAALGTGDTDAPSVEPTAVDTLKNEIVVDVSVGDLHCIALTKKHTVYTWGSNNFGQCGLGHTDTRVSYPTKLNMLSTDIYQIAAGATHSILWTAIPTEMIDSFMNWPYCLDMTENTFKLLREFLEKYCTGFDTNKPFDSPEDNNEFVVYCLNLLKLHLKCAVFLSNSQDSIGREIIPLGQLLFKLMDSSTPQPIQNAVNETLELGVTLLIPPLSERLHYLWSLIPKDNSQWTQLTKGQLIQLQVMLESLGNEQTVIGLLMPLIPGAIQDSDTIGVEEKRKTLLQLVDIMVKYVLSYMDKKIDESKSQVESGTDGSDTLTTQINQGISPKIISLFKDFLILLYKHIFANFAMKTEFTNDQLSFLRHHLDIIIPGCLETLEKIKLLALATPENLNIIKTLHFPNAIIPLVTHGLLLFPLHQLNTLIDPVTELCLQLSRTIETIPDLAQFCEAQEAEWKIGELEKPLLASPLSFPLSTELTSDWCWLVDSHRSGACLLGLLLNLQLTSLPVETQESGVEKWTTSVLLANGMQDNFREGILQWKQSTNGIMSCLPFSTEEIAESVLRFETAVPSFDIPETNSVAKLILDLAHARTEVNPSCSDAYNQLIQFATVREWDTNGDDDIVGLKEVSCGMLAAVAKHCRISILTPLHGIKTSEELSETYENIFRVRRELFSLRPLEATLLDGTETQSEYETEYLQLCATLRSLCLFLVCVVSPATKEVSDGTATSISSNRKQTKSSPKNLTSLPVGTARPALESPNSQSEKDSPLDSIAEYFQPKDTSKTSFSATQVPSLSSTIIQTLTEFLLEPIEAYKTKHLKEEQKSPSILVEAVKPGNEKNEKLLENIAFTMMIQKKRAELRLEALKLIQTLLLSRGSKLIGQISTILPTAYRLLQNSLLGNSGICDTNMRPFVILGNISSAPRDIQLKIKSVFNKILSFVFKQIAQAAKACTKAVENEKVPLYLDLVINMSWLQGKVQSFDVNEVCSPQILSVLAELSGIISTKLPLPFPVDNKLERCIRNIAALLFYYITAVVGYNSEDLNSSVIESVVGLLYGELEGQFIPYRPKISCKIPATDSIKQRSLYSDSADNTNDLQIQTPIDFLELSLPFEFDHPVHPETLKQLEKLWSTVSSEEREYTLGSYINYLTRVVSTAKMKSHFANTPWVGLLLRIAGVDPENCLPRCMSVRTRMLALNLLSSILLDHPRDNLTVKKKIIDVIFNQMSLCQFGQPVFNVKKCDTRTPKESNQKSVQTYKYTFENMTNSTSCSIEGNLIKKISRGDGHVFMNYRLTTEIYSWKIKLVNSDNANNSVFIGIVSIPFQDTAIKSTQCCWTMNTFSGNFFHNGQLPELFSSCVTGDTIQCVYNGATKKISFAKNSEPLSEVFQNIKSTEIYPFIAFNTKSTTASVEFTGLEVNTYNPTDRETIEIITSEFSHSFLPKPLVHHHICIAEGFCRLLRQLIQSENWQIPIQTCCSERFRLMDTIVQSLVNRTLTGHVEVHRLCFQIWPVLAFLANRIPVLSVGGEVYHEDENLFGVISLSNQKEPLVFFDTKGTKIQSPMLLCADKVTPAPLPKLEGFNWGQIGPITLLNLAHLSGLWDDEEMNVLTAGAPFLSRGYAKHLFAGQDTKDVTSSISVPIYVTASLEWRQILMWEVQAMALRTLQTVLSQDRFSQLLTYHPISIADETLTEDRGDLSHAVQQIMRHIVSRATSPSPIIPAVSLGCLETAHGLLTRSSMLKLYTDCADAILGSDKLDETELAIACIPAPPPDLPKLYHPTNVPPPIPPKTRRVSPQPVTPVRATSPVPAPTPAYVSSLLEMGFTEQQVTRARRKLKINSNESVANQTSSLVMWLLEHASEEDSGGETEVPPPLPPREEPLLFPLTLEQTLVREGGYPATPPTDTTGPGSTLQTADIPPKSETDRFLEGLFPDFNRTDFSVAKNLGKRNGDFCKDLLEGPDPTTFIRDVYRNIPEVAGELKDNCKQLFFKKNEGFLSSNPEPNQLSFTSEDPLGSKSVKSNKFSSDTENVFSRTDSQLLSQCTQIKTLDEYVNAMERVTNAIKTQVSRQLLLLSCSSLSLKHEDFLYGLTNIGIQDLTLLLRLLRLSATNRFGCFSSDLDNSVCIISAIKQVLSNDSVSLGRVLQMCTRDILAAAASTNSPESYFLSTHTNVSDSTVFATINFQVTQLLVEVVIEVINSPDNKQKKYEHSDACVYGVVGLADALSACEFSEKLSGDDKQWVTEQIVKLLIIPKEYTPHYVVKPELTLVDALLELKGHTKQVMTSVWSGKTAQLFSISKDNTIRVWNSINATEGKTSSTLEFSSYETETVQLSSDTQDTPHKLVPPSVLPYIAVDHTGEYIAASREYTVNVWYTGYVNNNNNNKQTLRCVEKLERLITYSCFSTPCTNSPTNKQPIDYIPSILFGCIDGSVYSAKVKLDSISNGELELEIRELEDVRLPDNGAVVRMVWDESGHTLAIGSSKGSVTLYSQQNSNEEINRDKTLVLHENVVHSLQFNNSGTLLATLAEGEAIKISGRLNGEWDNIGFVALPNQTCFSWLQSQTPQSKDLLACGGDRGYVYIWSIPHWPYDIQVASQSDASSLLDKQLELVTTCYSISSDISCIVFSLDGMFVLAGHKDGAVSMWLISSGEELVYTQINNPVVSITQAGSDRIVTCHLNSSGLHYLPLTPNLLFKTRTLYYCNGRLKSYGIKHLERVPFLQAFLSQLGSLLFRRHIFEQQEISNQRQLVHSPMHQSLSVLAIGLGLDTVWTQEYIAKLFPNIKLEAEFNHENWTWISSFRQALLAVESMARRTALPADFPGVSSPETETDTEAQLTSNWSVDSDTQLMQWSNQHPEDWILGGRAKVYFWGAGGSGQLANESKSTSRPELCSALECTQRIVASVNCTYAINHDGSVYSFGDGTYGKLGHNSTESFTLPQCIEALQGYIIVQLSASRSGDCHCLALSHNGEVFSWGDGEYGRLGHGDTTRQRKPKKIEGLKGKKVVMVSAGDKYSGVVTEEGQLLTFGSGTEGKTGHGSSDSKRVPKRITKFLKEGEEINVKIGQISCSASHTLAVSSDGNEVFSFGDGQHYKLGNGSTANVLSPQTIPQLSGLGVKKVACGNHFSLALTCKGKLYAWGHHTECCSATDIQYPQLLASNTGEGLGSRNILDVQTGPDYAIALTSCGEVWAWGSNKEGQLGLGDKDPRIQPCLIKDLVGKNIRQISAGKSHASASTSPPLSFLNLLDELGEPSCIPTKYTALANTSISLLRARLIILTNFSSIVFSQWTLLDSNPFEFSSINVLQTCLLNKAHIRPILSQNMFRSKMLQTVTHTMIASKSYGPIITVRRMPSEGHKHKPLFYQISPQILPKSKELLLPQRAWKVTLIGEGADDAGGVFDETIALMCIELEDGTLPFLIPTPNARNKCGYNTDRFVLNPACSSKNDNDYYKFIGILFGVAIRTKKPLALHLAPLVWKLIAGIEVTMDDLEEVDSAFMQAMRGIRQLSEDVTPETFSEMIPISSYEAYNMAGHLTPILLGGSNIPLTYANRKEYVEKSIQFRLHELDKQALSVREGMSLIIPVPLLSLTTGALLEIAVCGERELDIQVLKKVAKYRDCTANDTLIKWLWDSLENFTNDEKILFLRFTSGRSRLPARVQDVTQRLLVIKTTKNKNALPTAQTCFFQLKLPNYTSQEILASRLRYAINNCRSIDTDGYMLPRNTEGGATSSDDDY